MCVCAFANSHTVFVHDWSRDYYKENNILELYEVNDNTGENMFCICLWNKVFDFTC